MISAIEWIPAGVADPSPKKYELSTAEIELIEMMEKQNIEDAGNDNDDDEKNIGDDDDNDDEEEEEEEDDAINTSSKGKKNDKEKTSESVENNLPADLRMDEYSSDEDGENDAVQGMTVGGLLVEGNVNNNDNSMDETDANDNDDDDDKKNGDEDEGMDSGDDDDSDDDLADIPDTREFAPLDVEGFDSIGLSKVGTNTQSFIDFGDDGAANYDDDDSDAEDVQLQPDDALVVVAKTEEDFASLEVHVYEQKTGNLFVHHDIPLPAFPLCLAHGDISPSGTAGNYCAVGTFGPGIEIWNLDVLNALEPSCILGGEDTTMADEIMRHNMLPTSASNSNKKKNNKKKKNKKQPFVPNRPTLCHGSHTDAVMSLSWNKVHRQVIASGSADKTVKVWDVTKAGTDQCNAGTFSHHKDKVQSVLWHPQEGTLLATGSYDKSVCLVDATRSQDNVKKVKLPADCETLAWDPFSPQYLTAASEDGTIMCWDVRKFSDKTPLWSIVATEYGGVSDLAYNPHVPGFLASCSIDNTVTLWDTYNAVEKVSSGPPMSCGNKDMAVGKLYTINFYPSSPWLLGCAGSAKEIALWDMTREDSIQKRFGQRVTDTSTLLSTSSGVGNVSNQKANDDFNAMMSGTTTSSSSLPSTQVTTSPAEIKSKESKSNSSSSSSSKKKKSSSGGKKKKRVHRAGR